MVLKPPVKKVNNKKIKAHFMGIGGSGMSGIAILAKHAGFIVEGSDLQEKTPYIEKVKNENIPVFLGHNTKDLDGVSLLVVTPAVYFSDDQKFLKYAQSKSIEVITWQEFLGKYIHEGKKVISIAGAHGKSTTTALCGLVMDACGTSPSVSLGATVKEWGTNFKIGNSTYFVNEADEFFDNFLNYTPDTIILTNIEYEHPDYFKSEEQLFESYKKFVEKLKSTKTLIVNQDDPGIARLMTVLDKNFLKKCTLIGYTIENNRLFECPKTYIGVRTAYSADSSIFSFGDLHKDDKGEVVFLGIPGEHNVYNSLAVLSLVKHLNLDFEKAKKVLFDFHGISRRIELIGEESDIKVYDDYAHHPTEIKASISALRQKYPNNKLWAIFEPHSFSRTKTVLNQYETALVQANTVVVLPIFKARDTNNFGIGIQDVIKAVNKKGSKGFTSFDEAQKHILTHARKGDIMLVMGAGQSYQFAYKLLESLKK